MTSQIIRKKLELATPYEKYVVARWCYAIGVTYLDDKEYAVLEADIKHDNCTDLVYKTWSTDNCPTEILQKYCLDELIKQNFVVQGIAESIPNCSSDNMLAESLKSAGDLSFCRMSYKLDGVNVQCHFIDGKFQNAHTRGRAARPMDVAVMQYLTHDIPFMGHVVIAGELIIPNDKWLAYKDMTGNVSQRNSVMSIIANCDHEYAKWVCYKIDGDQVPKKNKYDLIKEAGYEVPDYIEFDGTGYDVAKVKEKLKQFEPLKYKYPSDGVVFENNSFQIALRLLHYSEQVLIGKIIGYKEEFGAYGTSFQIQIKPLNVAGITRQFIPIQNLGNIIDNNLRVGMPICFNIRSQVAPVFNQIAQNKLITELKSSGIMKDDYSVEESYFEQIYKDNEQKEYNIEYDENDATEEMANLAAPAVDMSKINMDDIITF